MFPSRELIQIGFLASLAAGLATGAGAVLFVVCDELIPESHRKGHERDATFGLITGLIIMMVLDTVLG